MTPETRSVRGSDLRVGDIMPNMLGGVERVIVELERRHCPLTRPPYNWEVWTARFSPKYSMAIIGDDWYTIVRPGPVGGGQ